MTEVRLSPSRSVTSGDGELRTLQETHKCSGYVQSWTQQAPSRPSFDIASKRGWDAATNTFAAAPGRPAQVYVFALHHHRELATADLRDVSQWSFYVLPTAVLNQRLPTGRSLSLGQLEKLSSRVGFGDLAGAVGDAVKGPDSAA